MISSCFNGFSPSIALLKSQSEDYERKEDNARKRPHRDFSAAPRVPIVRPDLILETQDQELVKTIRVFI